MDLIYVIDARRASLDPNNKANLIGPDGPGLMQTIGYVKARVNSPRFLIVPVGQDCETTRQQINQMDPGGTATLFVWGDMAIPWVAMFSPDGHGEYTAWSSLAPWQMTANVFLYQAQGNATYGWGPYYLPGAAQPTRVAGIVSLGSLSGTGLSIDALYTDYLTRLNAYLSGADYYERMGVCVNHLSYLAFFVPLGTALQAQVDAAFGAGNWIQNDFWDHDPGDFPLGVNDPGWTPYYAELAGHQPVLYALFSGGLDGTREFYIATSASAETLKPHALHMPLYGSSLGNFELNDGLARAFLCGSLSSVWVGGNCPDYSLWLSGVQSLGETIRRHAWNQGNPAVNLCGFPLLFVNSAAQVAAAQGVPLTSADMTTIQQMLSNLAASIKQDYTQAIAAAVQQTTSAGQTGSPTGTTPATGTSGSGTASGGGTSAGTTAPAVIDAGFEQEGAATGFAGVTLLPPNTWKGSGQVEANNSAAGNAAAPEGTHILELQYAQYVEQVVTGFTPGTSQAFHVYAAYRKGYAPGTVSVLVDGVSIGKITPTQPSSVGFSLFTLPFTPSAVSHTVRIVGDGSGIVHLDKVAFG